MMKIALMVAVALLLAAPAAPAADAQQQEQNKEVVVDFYEKGLNQKDFEAASKHLGPRYTQHNPNADGDYVIVHVPAVREPGTRGVAVVEHGDVVQPIPEKAANTNGMF